MEEDIRIFKEKENTPENNSIKDEYSRENERGNILKGKTLGTKIAEMLLDRYDEFSPNLSDENSEMALQKGILLCFSATIAMEENCDTSVVLQVAKNSFNEKLKDKKIELYEAIQGGSEFSFYYLAYRRGTEIDRRIGQTFAMLCSHDGDPVYQELGEALYCWFLSVVKDKIQ